MTLASPSSASNTVEQAGSMISSMNTMCIGIRISGQPIATGIRDNPAMGTCTAKIYAIAFLRLSNILRPSRIAATMDEKSSSSRTSPEASRATSVPRPPIATPISEAFSAGASLTPSPVIATTSPFALSAWTSRSFCSGPLWRTR